jgi:predicted secreted hydrolase
VDACLVITGGGVGQPVAGDPVFTAKHYRRHQNGGMKKVFLFFIVFVAATSARSENANNGGWAIALPGYQITLPADHYPHYQFRTEWWYFTGNVQTAVGREFGYQLTFFRFGYRPPGIGRPAASRFVMNDLKFAHFAVTDVSAAEFHFDSRVSRGAYGEAGFGDGDRLAWIDDWELDLSNIFRLKAAAKDYSIELELTPERPPVFQGENGLSQKADGAGHASYYYSITRLNTSGTIKIGAETYPVKGSSWFDREWATNQLAPEQSGWNWFAIQLSDGGDMMLYQMRLKRGGIDSHSTGKWIAPGGATSDLTTDEFRLSPEKYWVSPASKANYPVVWKLTIPKLDLELDITPVVEDQELNLGVVYWEGSIRLTGQRAGKPVHGVGYMELTGYAAGTGEEEIKSER